MTDSLQQNAPCWGMHVAHPRVLSHSLSHSHFPCKDPKRPRGQSSCHINIRISTVKWPLTTYFSLPFLSRMGFRTLRTCAGTALLQMYKNPGIYYSCVSSILHSLQDSESTPVFTVFEMPPSALILFPLFLSNIKISERTRR